MTERYIRHINLKQIGETGQKKLQQSSVLIVGVGGLGSPISLYLTAAGLGRIGLIDFDTVSLSNLQRQILYTENDLGKPKVEIAYNKLKALNSELKIDIYNFKLTVDNAEEIISNYDIIVDGCDNFDTRYCIDDICNKLEKPYVYGSIGEFKGQVSVFNYKGSKSYRDLFPENYSVNNDLPGVMGVTPGITGTIQAAEVIKIITESGEVLRNKLLIIDILSMKQILLDY